MDLVFLHGFASGPLGVKAQFCRRWAEGRGIRFEAPDLNLPDFEHLTITAQVEAVETLLRRLEAPPVLAGSSMGGLVAAAVAARGLPISRLILIAPALGFARRILTLPPWADYRRRGEAVRFHHKFQRELRIGPELLHDLPRWLDDDRWQIDIPVVILHGTRDDLAPITESEAFVARQPQATLHRLEDDHSLFAPASLERLERCLMEAWEGRIETAPA